MTNFERATLRMQARGCHPFKPDINHGRAARVLRGAPARADIEPDALPIDRLIGWVGAIGSALIVIGIIDVIIKWVAA